MWCMTSITSQTAINEYFNINRSISEKISCLNIYILQRVMYFVMESYCWVLCDVRLTSQNADGGQEVISAQNLVSLDK